MASPSRRLPAARPPWERLAVKGGSTSARPALQPELIQLAPAPWSPNQNCSAGSYFCGSIYQFDHHECFHLQRNRTVRDSFVRDSLCVPPKHHAMQKRCRPLDPWGKWTSRAAFRNVITDPCSRDLVGLTHVKMVIKKQYNNMTLYLERHLQLGWGSKHRRGHSL